MHASDSPLALDARREAVAERFERAPGVLCCLDFDGTLAPIVDDPDEAAIDPACQSLVADLAASDWVTVAVVSGRAIDDLSERVGLEDLLYAGNHGLELRRSERTEVHPEAAKYEAAISEVCDEIADRTGSIAGCRIENKGVTATVHYRQVAETAVPALVDAVESVVAGAEDLVVTTGRKILEIRPDVDWGKGRVVSLLAEDVDPGWEAVYVGDDTTDEDAFEVVEPDGLGVLVGERAETAASMRIPNRGDVADFLGLVAEHQDPR